MSDTTAAEVTCRMIGHHFRMTEISQRTLRVEVVRRASEERTHVVQCFRCKQPISMSTDQYYRERQTAYAALPGKRVHLDHFMYPPK